MGRPLNKKYFGDPLDDGNQLSVDVWFTGEGSAEPGWIVRQRGTGIFEITNGTLTERLKLQNSAPSAEGQASMQVNPFGTTGVTAVVDTVFETTGVVIIITIASGGSGYLTPPVVTITDAGPGTGATAVGVLTGDAVTSVTITSSGGGYASPSATFAAPTGGDLEFVRTILSHGVKTWLGNVYNWDVIAATQTGEGDLPLS